MAANLTSMFCPAWIKEEDGFMNRSGFVGTVFPSSATWSLKQNETFGQGQHSQTRTCYSPILLVVPAHADNLPAERGEPRKVAHLDKL
jgi:hypothetical protein